MHELFLNNVTQKHLEDYLSSPTQGLCLVGPPGAGKNHTALQLASRILSNPEKDAIYSVGSEGSIGIEEIRKLQHFLQLKKPGKELIRRIVIINNAQNMGSEAQNALLKTLEEPPADTIFILTATSLAELKPTIRSRVQVITIKPLSLEEAQVAFAGNKTDLSRAYPLSGGYAGLLYALMHDPDHQLVKSVTLAKQLLQAPLFERLAMVDELAKHKNELPTLFYALQRVLGAVMAHAKPERLPKLIQSLRALYEAEQDAKRSANTKLLLTDLMLHL